MTLYLIRRVNLALITLLLLTLFSFSLGHLFPGDVVTNFTGLSKLSDADYREISQSLKLDAPIWQQYWAYLVRLTEGDWGLSLTHGSNILHDIWRHLPATLELIILSLCVALVIGIPLGVASGVYFHSPMERLITTTTLIGYSLPVFWLALIMILLFAVEYPLFPISGRIGLLYDIPDKTGFIMADIWLSDVTYKWEATQNAIRHLILPTFVLCLLPTTVIIRVMRNSMNHVMRENYIKAARAKGLALHQIIFRHALRNAMFPVIRQIGLQLNSLLTLSMLTEVIFAWPGMGRWLIEAIYQQDFPSIQGGLLAMSLFVIIANILTELIHLAVNPTERRNINGTH